MGKLTLKIVLSIILGISFLRFGYNFKNDWLSIITQAIGYVIISYPFYLFFKALFFQIKYDINRKRLDKKFYSQKGKIYGNITLGEMPLSLVKCVVRNEDGTNNKWTHRWISHSGEDGYYEVKFLTDGTYSCNFSYKFYSGTIFEKNVTFKIEGQNSVEINLNLKK